MKGVATLTIKELKMKTVQISHFKPEAFVDGVDPQCIEERKKMIFNMECNCCREEATVEVFGYDGLQDNKGFYLCDRGTYTPWAAYADGTVDIMEIKKQR